jgi:hypothetical protein
MTRLLWFAPLGFALIAAPASSQPLVFVGVPVTMVHDGDLDSARAAIVFGATSTSGAGFELRVTRTTDVTITAASFIQVAPAPRRGKTLQPYGAVGIALVRRSGESLPALNLAGGLLAFFTGHIGAELDARYVRGPVASDDVLTLARTIAGGLAIRF